MPERKVTVQVQLTPEQAEALKRKYRSKDAGKALEKLLTVAAGLWLLGEAIRREDAPRRRTRCRSMERNT